MIYIEAPKSFVGQNLTSLFLAGGISQCPDWQKTVIEELKDTNLVLLNPRRKHFDISDQNTTLLQINWEHTHLSLTNAILFWFPSETLCPITLLELGSYLKSDKPLFIGCHPDYQRKLDVEIQSRLVRPHQIVHNNLYSLVQEVKQWLSLPEI